MSVDTLVELVSKHLPLLHSGKVRDSFRVFGPNDGRWRLILVTDRRSIFDFKLGFVIPEIGEILNATNIFFRKKMTGAGIPHDMLACGAELDRYLPNALQNLPALQKRGMLVKELQMYPVECVARQYLTGSAWDMYSEEDSNQVLCGHILRRGLVNGSPLQSILFTPTTKAEKGHDIPLNVREVNREYPLLEDQALDLFSFVSDLIEKTNRFVWVDGKAEGGVDPDTGLFTWADEVGTFDSSRIWASNEYHKVWPGKVPASYDKENLRTWGREVGINKLDPLSDGDKEHVLGLTAPEEIIATARTRAFDFFFDLTGYSCADFQTCEMGI
jgi:phosphoribosylaminoimidazole-succinocarboxamide synthase